MCGILAIFGSSLPENDLRKKLIECSLKLRHRGPDWSGYFVDNSNAIAHERLAIIDPESGAQPLYSKDKTIVVAANGEIYNYKSLYSALPKPFSPTTGSDCEVVIPLYQQVFVYFL
jgi:asparagine synthase (glutamine-hydrolysing)